MAEYFTEFLNAAVATECIATCACHGGAGGAGVQFGLNFSEKSVELTALGVQE
jgi:hypothetical protein